MEPIQRLDYVLNFLHNNPAVWPFVTDGELRKELGKNIDYWNHDNSSDLNRILDKLVNDGYVYKELRHVEAIKRDIANYRISFDGELHVINGGYASQNRREALKIQIQNRNQRRQIYRDKLLIIGSWIAGIGTIALAVIEILKQFVWKQIH